MAVDFLPQSSLFIGIIPALALVYLIIRKWQGQFQEKMVFLLFVFGIISSFTLIFVEFYIGFTTLLEFIIIFRLIELLGKMIILNLPRFQEKQETVLYGLVLGLGFGSIYPPVSLLLINTVAISQIEVLSVLLGSIGMIFLQGSTGALIGNGVFKRRIITPLIWAFVLHVFYQYLLFSLSLSLTWVLSIIGVVSYLLVMKFIVLPVSKQSDRRKRTVKKNKTIDS